jgi:hypothetical protein
VRAPPGLTLPHLGQQCQGCACLTFKPQHPAARA